MKLMILVNVVLGLLYVVSTFVLWRGIGEWVSDGDASWSPLYITPLQGMYFMGPPIRVPLLNIPLLLFMVMFAVNLFFIIRLGRNKASSVAYASIFSVENLDCAVLSALAAFKPKTLDFQSLHLQSWFPGVVNSAYKDH